MRRRAGLAAAVPGRLAPIRERVAAKATDPGRTPAFWYKDGVERRSLEVPGRHAGEAIARVVHDGLGVAHATAKGLIDAGCVTINGRAVRSYGQRCSGGDVVEIRFDPERRYHPTPPSRLERGFRVVYDDRDIVVVDKAPGVLTTPAAGDNDESLAERIAGSLRRRGI